MRIQPIYGLMSIGKNSIDKPFCLVKNTTLVHSIYFSHTHYQFGFSYCAAAPLDMKRQFWHTKPNRRRSEVTLLLC